MSEFELKACPFCGDKHRKLMGYDYHKVGCSNVFCKISVIAFTPDEWNTRADRWISVDERLPSFPDTHSSNSEVVRVATSSGNIYYAIPRYARYEESEGVVYLSCVANGLDGFSVLFDVLNDDCHRDAADFYPRTNFLNNASHWEPLPLPQPPKKGD